MTRPALRRDRPSADPPYHLTRRDYERLMQEVPRGARPGEERDHGQRP